MIRKPAIFYCVRKDSLLVQILIQMNPVPTFTFQFSKISFNCTLPLMSGPSSGFPTKSFYALIFMHARSLAHLILLDLITQIIFSEEYRLWSSLLCSLIYLHYMGLNFLCSIFAKLLIRMALSKSKIAHEFSLSFGGSRSQGKQLRVGTVRLIFIINTILVIRGTVSMQPYWQHCNHNNVN
jgi:hypothetical protein